MRGQQRTFETALIQDYVLAFLVGAVLSYIGGLIASRIGFFSLLLAPLAGSLIAEAIRRVVNKRRSPTLFRIAAAGVALGAAPFLLFPLLVLLSSGSFGAIFRLLWPAIYMLIVTPTVYVRLSGIQMG